jgi:MFS family permease
MSGRRFFVDVAPLRLSRDFRWVYGGQMVSFLGTQLTVVAVPYQVYRLTHSSLQVGLVSLVQLVPLIVGSFIGGSIVDGHDRRQVLLVTEILLALTSVGLAANATVAHPALWPLYVITAVAAALSGVASPAYTATIPNLVADENLPAAYALWQVLMQVGAVAGPGLAGLLLAGTGLSVVYWTDVASFAAAFVSVLAIRPQPPSADPDGEVRKPGVRSIVEGLRYLKGRQVLQGVFLLDINAMVFGMPRALFPALGTKVFKGGARAVGLLYAAPGAGALLGAITTGWVGRVRRQGRAVILAVAVWGLAIAAFGAVRSLPIALVLLALAGWADVISAIFRSTILQRSIPDQLRGRMSAVQIAVVTGGPRLGDFEAGAVASAVSVPFSVISGGLACMAGAAVLGRRLPRFARYREGEDSYSEGEDKGGYRRSHGDGDDSRPGDPGAG